MNKEESKMETFDEKRIMALRALYDYVTRPDAGSGTLSGAEIKRVISSVAGGGFASAIFDTLFQSKFILQIAAAFDEHDGLYEITPDFFRAVETMIADANVPTADGFVSLDHNSEPYKQAVSSLNDVVKEFRDDKTKDNELGQEKAVLLRMLEAGREYLNDAKVRVQTIIASVIEPLKIIAAKYDQAVVGALAGTALNLLLELLGIL